MTRTVMLSKDPLEKASRAKISVPKLESLLNLQKYNIMYYILRREAKGNIKIIPGLPYEVYFEANELHFFHQVIRQMIVHNE